MRTLVALVLLIAAVVASVFPLAAVGGPDAWAAAYSLALLALGFWSLRVARAPERPLRPLRIALGAAVVMCLFLLAGLPWPPLGESLRPALTLSAAALASVAAALLAARTPRAAAGLLLLLAVYGAILAVGLVRTMLDDTPLGRWGPALVLSLLLAAALSVAWIGALMHSGTVWRAARGRPVASERSRGREPAAVHSPGVEAGGRPKHHE